VLEERRRDGRQGDQYRHQSQEFAIKSRGAASHVFEVDERRAFLTFYAIREIRVVAVITKETATFARVAPFDTPCVAVFTDVIAIAA
jgi:hypothetical protein